jgi:hypothetical protein
MQTLTVRCKLDGSDAQRAEMAATVEAFAQACRYVARETPQAVTSKYELQAQCYPVDPRAFRALCQPRNKGNRPRRCESQGGKGHRRKRRQLSGRVRAV